MEIDFLRKIAVAVIEHDVDSVGFSRLWPDILDEIKDIERETNTVPPDAPWR